MFFRSLVAAWLFVSLQSCTYRPIPADEVVEANVELPIGWLALAEQGDADAQRNLGLMYDNGDGVPENDIEAVKWYRLAAEQGDALAQSYLGLMYADGEGIPENDINAYAWWSLAATQGHESASENKGIITKRMTRQQIAEAQAYATRCFENDYKGCD